MNYDEWQLLSIHYLHDTPENRAEGEKALRDAGVNGDIRIMSQTDIIENRVLLLMDGYKLIRKST